MKPELNLRDLISFRRPIKVGIESEKLSEKWLGHQQGDEKGPYVTSEVTKCLFRNVFHLCTVILEALH